MGCDIHVHIEIKIAGKWVHYGAPKVKRYYELFNLMGYTGRCSGYPSIAPIRGLPIEVSSITLLDYYSWGSDAHSVSYIKGDELAELQGMIDYHMGQSYETDLEHGIFNTYLFGNSFSSYATCDVVKIEDVQVVFWFDN